jgi:hypothetical protein
MALQHATFHKPRGHAGGGGGAGAGIPCLPCLVASSGARLPPPHRPQYGGGILACAAQLGAVVAEGKVPHLVTVVAQDLQGGRGVVARSEGRGGLGVMGV